MSRSRRFYAPDLVGPSVTLAPDEAHHALNVLKLRGGDEVELFDGRGLTLRGTISSTTAGTVKVELGEELRSVESPLDLTVALAVPKPDRMAFAVQKLTELGTRRIIPLSSERSARTVRKSSELERWRRIVLEATKQSGRSRLAEVSPRRPLADVLDENTTEHVLMAHPGASALRTADLPDEMSPILTLIGPEGGWTEDELDLGRRHAVRFFGMGPRVLRTETAAVAAATLLQAHFGDD